MLERVANERRENEKSANLVAKQYGLPPEMSAHILSRVGDPTGTRTFEIGNTQQAQFFVTFQAVFRTAKGQEKIKKKSSKYKQYRPFYQRQVIVIVIVVGR